MQPDKNQDRPGGPQSSPAKELEFSSPESFIKWLTSKGIKREVLETSCGNVEFENRPEIFLLYQDGPVWKMTSAGKPLVERALRETEKTAAAPAADLISDTHFGTAGLPQIPGVKDHSQILFSMRLAVAQIITRDKQWQFGAAALAEIDQVVDRLRDRLRTSDEPKLKIPTGTVLESYFLSGTSSARPISLTEAPRGALSAMDSMHCLHDEARTKAFLRGIKDAVGALARDRDAIHVVDAGCGAIPVLSIYAALCSPKVHVTAIELNPESRLFAQSIIDKFGFRERIHLVEADARFYAPKQRTDLLLSETMASALTGEPIVDILARQTQNLNPGALVLPSAVIVKAGIVPVEQYERAKTNVVLFTLTTPKIDPIWQDQIAYAPGENLKQLRFLFSTEGLAPGRYAVVVTSDVQVGSRVLGLYDSIISSPSLVHDSSGSGPLNFRVEPGMEPSHIGVSYPAGGSPEGHCIGTANRRFFPAQDRRVPRSESQL